MKLQSIYKLALICLVGLVLSSCGKCEVSGGSKNDGTTTIGTLANGMSVYSSSKYYTASSAGANVSASIGITNGVYGESYTISFESTTQTKVLGLLSVSDSVFPFGTTTPTPCVVIAGSPESSQCPMFIHPNNAAVGTYYLNPIVTNNLTGVVTKLAQIPVMITAGDANQAGMLSIAVNSNPIVTSATGIVTLSNSSGVESTTVNLAATFPGVTIEPTTCVVSSLYPTCSFTITGSTDGSGVLKATATGYAPATTPQMSIRMQWGVLRMKVTNPAGDLAVRLGESAVITVWIESGIGVTNQTINLKAANQNVLPINTSCVIASSAESYNSCSVVVASGQVGTTKITGSNPHYTDVTYDAVIVLLYSYSVDWGTYVTRCAFGADGLVSGDCSHLGSFGGLGVGLTIESFNNNYYMYVSNTSNSIQKCRLTLTGEIDGSCETLTNTPTPFYQTYGITFQTFNGTTYGYVSDATTNVWKCPMTADGSFASGCTALTSVDMTNNSGVIFNQAANGNMYMYVTNYPGAQANYNMQQCQMTSSGDISACSNFPSNISTNVFSYTLSISSFGGNTYIYMPNQGSGLYRAQLDADGAPIGASLEQVFNNGSMIEAYSPSYFYTFNGTLYGYVGVSGPSVRCVTNPATGLFVGACTSVPEINTVSALIFHVFAG